MTGGTTEPISRVHASSLGNGDSSAVDDAIANNLLAMEEPEPLASLFPSGPDQFVQELPVQHVAATVTPDRTECREIQGTEYHSVTERDWYLANCLESADATYTTLSSVQEQFIAGYVAGGGPLDLLPHVIRVVDCESTWDNYVVSGNGLYYGLGQFDAVTWYGAGGGDWTDPYTQGYRMAYLILTSNPGGRWPTCWFR
jgi:hypothetical protein